MSAALRVVRRATGSRRRRRRRSPRLRVLPDGGGGHGGRPDRRVIAIAATTRSATSTCRVSRTASGPSRRAVHDDGWKIAACPVNGPMLSARGRDVAIAWFTATGRPAARLRRVLERRRRDVRRADSAGRRRRARPRRRRAARRRHRRWRAGSSSPRRAPQLRVRRVTASGSNVAGDRRVRAWTASRASGYPRLAVHGTRWSSRGPRPARRRPRSRRPSRRSARRRGQRPWQ